jgi:hypothetical protein
MENTYKRIKKLSEEVLLEQHFKSMFSDLDDLNKKNLKSSDRQHIELMLSDVKSMYQTALDIVLRTSMMKLQYV